MTIDVIRLAKEAHGALITEDYPGHTGQLDPWTLRLLERFAALVAASDKADAERYRWLREQHWEANKIGVVIRPKNQTKLGSLLPSGSLLDSTVDHMMGAAIAKHGGAA